MGLRPVGLAVGRDSEDLDQEELALEDERVSSGLAILIDFETEIPSNIPICLDTDSCCR